MGPAGALPGRGVLRLHRCGVALTGVARDYAVAVRALAIDVRDFVIHDFRRTASTHLHEAGFNSDWIEKCLAHETKGIRGVYNRAQYADQRREMLQWWADFVDSQIQDGRGKVIIGSFGKAYQSAA